MQRMLSHVMHLYTANELLTEDAMIEDLQDQLILVTPELTEAHEMLVSQYCNEGRKIDDASSSTARREVQDAVIGSSRALEFLPSCGITPDSLTCHTTAGKIVTVPL